MDKTTVMVEFSIYGEGFEPDYITEELEIKPSETYLKGEPIKNGNIIRKETAWTISTGYEVSIDVNEQLEKIIVLLADKVDKLVELKRKLGFSTLFMLVIKIEKDELPAIYFRKDFIHFASKIDADIGLDTYIL
jgi:hypothetical protein